MHFHPARAVAQALPPDVTADALAEQAGGRLCYRSDAWYTALPPT